jgi:flagellar assembly factor FliW
MTANTQYAPSVHQLFTPFGSFVVADQDVIEFPSGVPGYEDCKRFVVLSSAELGPLSCLQSVGDGRAVSFFVVDPRRVLPEYRCALSQTDMMRLGVGLDGVLLWLAIVSFDEQDCAFVNLRAPIVINPERMLGYQVMPHNSLYPLRHPLTAD